MMVVGHQMRVWEVGGQRCSNWSAPSHVWILLTSLLIFCGLYIHPMLSVPANIIYPLKIKMLRIPAPLRCRAHTHWEKVYCISVVLTNRSLLFEFTLHSTCAHTRKKLEVSYLESWWTELLKIYCGELNSIEMLFAPPRLPSPLY